MRSRFGQDLDRAAVLCKRHHLGFLVSSITLPTNLLIALLAPIWTPLALAANSIPDTDCVINPYQTVDLSSPAPGVLEAIKVDRSDVVEPGQVLALLEAGVERANLQLAEARAKLDDNIRLEQVNLSYDRRHKERIDAVYTNRAISPQDLDRAERDVDLSRIKLNQARALQHIRKLELHRAEELLRQKTVRSPIQGVVMERFKSAGEYVEDQPILRVAQLDPLLVEVILPMELFGRIQPGMAAEIYAENVATNMRIAQVSLVDRVGDPASGTFGVRLVLPNPDLSLPAGLKCNLRWIESPLPGQAEHSMTHSTAPLS